MSKLCIRFGTKEERRLKQLPLQCRIRRQTLSKCLPYQSDSDAALFAGLKDRAYYCYCAYVLRISRYSGFLWVAPTNAGIFLRGLKLCGESRTQQVLLISKKKIAGNHAFFRDKKASILNKTPYIALYFTRLFRIIVA